MVASNFLSVKLRDLAYRKSSSSSISDSLKMVDSLLFGVFTPDVSAETLEVSWLISLLLLLLLLLNSLI